MYRYIPTYIEFETHFFASIKYLWMFIQVIFGGERKVTYRKLYNELLARNTQSINMEGENTEYFMPLWIVGLLVVNIITIPSFFNQKYTRYKYCILQGIIMTILFICIWIIYGWSSNLQTILLFPMIHLMSFAKKDPNTRAPIVSLGISLSHIFSRSKTQITELTKKEEKVSFSYETPKEEAEAKIASL